LDDALKYCDEILLINPKNKRIKSIISYVAFKKVKLSSYNIEALTAFESICEKYEFLKENNRYNISLAYLYGHISLKKFNSKNISVANEYLQKLEYILDNNDLLDEVSNRLLADLFVKAGNYYYYKFNYKTAYKIYKKGLTYLPKHNDLKKRANWAKEEL
jgi:tetratricopeptide (TPR) repeat protein